MAGFSTDPQVSLDRVLNIERVTHSDNLEADYELNKCAEWITDNGYSKVCLQFPDGLLVDSVDVALFIERRSSKKVFILGDTSYGSCCVDEVAAQHVSGDAVIHFGHACLSPVSLLPVLYVFNKARLNVPKFYSELGSLNLRGPTLVLYDVSYSNVLDELRNSMPDELKRFIVLSELDIGSKHANPCCPNCDLLDGKERHSNLKLARAYCQPETGFEVFIYIGEKDNPNLKNFLCSLKGLRCICYNDLNGFQDISETNILKQCSYVVERLKNSENIGILAGTLGVKGYLEALTHVKKLCSRAKKKSYVIAVGKPNPAKLANFPEIDVFVAISCAEADFGDKKNYLQPIVSVFEVELAFNENRTWDSSYSRDFRDLIPGGSEYIKCPEGDISSDAESVSLASSKIKTSSTVRSDCTDLVVKPDMAVNLINSASFSRTWNGLEQSLDDGEAKLATFGRSGTASSYANETELTGKSECSDN